VFAEGTSCTEPAIAQVKEGVTWAAIEYIKAVAPHATREAGRDLMIVPAAIVYTNKCLSQPEH
jgi:glycerol-3-phosphate O-acyltransferase/dihydroxyacetone phosphate acyltransferase